MTNVWFGRWRVVDTDLWGDDSLDLLEQAYIEFGTNQIGAMVVGALQADIDYRIGERDGRSTSEFSWVGDDDGHPAAGRGWAQIEPDRTLRVKLYIHHGDDVAMTGQPVGPAPRRPSSKRGPARGGPRRRR